MADPIPTVLVFDSGLGGLTVFTELAKARPDARFVYCADDAAFPYGPRAPDNLIARVLLVMERLIARYQPDCVVVACNTASTLVLPALRQRFSIPFVGTVPAVKPAAAASLSRIIAVLATPGTVARDYTQELIRSYASDCQVELVGSSRLAGMAEAVLHGESVADADIAAEIAPCFVTKAGRRTDVIALSCTHYPLLLDRFEALAPWMVRWLDPAAAIARRMNDLLPPQAAWKPDDLSRPIQREPKGRVVFTSGRVPPPVLFAALMRYGLVPTEDKPIPAMP